MDDIAEEDELGWAVFGDQCFQAVDGVVGDGDGEELAGVAMGPGVAEVEIGGNQSAMLRQPEDVAGVEVEAGGEGVEVVGDVRKV